MSRITLKDELEEKLLALHCCTCEGMVLGCTGCSMRNDVAEVLSKYEVRNGVKWQEQLESI